MSDESTFELARAAGLHAQWTDYRGRPHAVPVDTLRRLLAALELPADDDRQCRDTLQRLRDEQQMRWPALLVGRIGQPLSLPPGLARFAGSDPVLFYENGDDSRLHCERDADGCLRISGIYRPGYHRLQFGEHAVDVAIAPAYRPENLALLPPRWGIAAQLYGLRAASGATELGIGDFSALAALARELGAHGAQALAISPVHALFSADVDHCSPYSPSSRLFLNVLHVDPAAFAGSDWLREQIGLLGLDATIAALAAGERVDWPTAARARLQLLRRAFDMFDRIDSDGCLRAEFDAFCCDGGAALREHVRFEAIHAERFGADPQQWHWRHWPSGLRDPQGSAVAEFADAHADDVAFHCFLQWLADRGLRDAQAAARGAGMSIGLLSDLAVGTDSGGSHAWSRQHDLLAGASIGAPPDELNARGQNWGLTTFSPRALVQHGYVPFIEMLRASLRHAGGVRIDHILGMNRLWLVPEGGAAGEGAYVDYPRHALLDLISLEASRHHATVVGEDLGTVPAGFREELAEAGLLGMRVLYFEREHGYFVEPGRWSPLAAAMTSTHDLPPVAGWWQGHDLDWKHQLNLLPPGSDIDAERADRASQREALWAAFRHAGVAEGAPPEPQQTGPVVDAAIAFVAATPSALALIPLEDLLGQHEQPNLPGTTVQHPNWQRRQPAASAELLAEPPVAARIARLQAARPGA